MAETSVHRQDPFLRDRYELLWANSVERIRLGNVEIDPILARKEADFRRGMTLVIRPSERVRLRVDEFLDELRVLEPDQYYYHPSELHVTFLSLFTATVEHEAFFERTGDYEAAVTSGASRLNPFSMFFHGITASPGAIMVQGFTDAGRLNAGRDGLRQELRSRGFNRGLDERYRLETAHMTVARFRQPLRNARSFAEALDQARTFDFGTSEVDSLELVRNDWCMSRERTECLRLYELAV